LSWAVYGVFVRATALQQMAWIVNSVSHTWGYRTYATRDQSVNCWWLTLPSLGEGWHNNHHAFPTSASFGLRWYELDLGFVAIRLLQTLHLAWDVVLADEKVADRGVASQLQIAVGNPGDRPPLP
jgi:fatty-acid desaturase